MTTLADIYEAEREACRCQFLAEAAEHDCQRARKAYVAAVARVRELVRDAVERVPDELEKGSVPYTGGQTLFDSVSE